MVRRGRLSKGCQTCRKRKIKCDQLRPACSQCLTAGWTCPQYGDSVERMFQYLDLKELNKSTSNDHPRSDRIVASEISCQPLSPEAEPATNTVITSRSSVSPQKLSCVSLPQEITESVDGLAMDFFFSTHIFRDSSGPVRGYYEYLSVMRSDPKAGKAFSTALSAVALVAYASAFRFPDVLSQARRVFGSALGLVNAALSSPQEAIKDSSIASILLLNTFNNITCETVKSLSNCHIHVTLGALTIIKLRGHLQFKSRHGQQLFFQICSKVLQGCLIRSARVPIDLIQLRKDAEMFVDVGDPAWKLHNYMVKLADFLSDVADGVLGDHVSIVETATILDSELSSFGSDMPVEWQFETLAVKEDLKSAYGTYYHVYPDLWVAIIWNNIRTCRILLHEKIINRLITEMDSLPAPPSCSIAVMKQHISASTSTLQRLTLDMCATIPQHLSNLSKPLHYSPNNFDGSELPKVLYPFSDRANNDIPTTAAVYFLLWPFLIAERVIDLDSQREYVINNCRFLGWKTGIEQAFTLANVYEGSEKMPYLHFLQKYPSEN